MKPHPIQVVPKRDDATVEPDALEHLSDMKDFMIADPDPDIRGWKVVLPDGTKVGKVDDLIVDTSTMTVRYLEVKLDHHVLGTDEDTWRLVPVGTARVDDKEHVVVLDRLPVAGLAGAPKHARGIPTREQQRELDEYYGRAARSEGDRGDGLFDHDRFWGACRTGREGTPYVTRRTEAGKRR
jgi:sporulation protein YlmC with PRC-barrel domain